MIKKLHPGPIPACGPLSAVAAHAHRKKAANAAKATPASSNVPAQTYRWISVLLVLGHVLETAFQIYLCYHYWQLTTRWAAGLAAELIATVAVINAASIIGVRRGLDFADRWFGQCLCYVMHFSLLGMVWRFLKLTFLYDRTDLREFALLRFVQVHLQTLPSLLLQTCLIYQHGLLNVDVTALPIGLAIAQLVIAGATISITTLVLSMPTSGVIMAAAPSSPPPPPAKCVDEEMMIAGFPTRRQQHHGGEERGCSTHQCVITAVRSVCLLWCRVVAVGVFMTEFHVWTLIVFGVHWCIALLWLVLQDSASELHPAQGAAPPSPAVSLFRRALVAYLLVFDWPPRYQPKHSGWSSSHKAVNPALVAPAAGSWLDVIGLGGEPRSVAVALYYGISGVENAAMLSLWFHFAPPSALVPPVARLTTLATCTAALTLGVLCVVASTQGPDEEASSSTSTLTSTRALMSAHSDTTSTSSSSSTTSSMKPLAAPCTVVQQREVRTVVAQVHPPRSSARLTQTALNMAANHSHPPMEPPPPPPPDTTCWETAISVCDDQSSNSRNTNTLDGALISGSGSCPSPPLYNAPIGLMSVASGPLLDPMTPRVSPFRKSAGSGAGSLSSTQQQAMVKRPYCVAAAPLSSTPRLVRRNSSSLMKPTRNRVAKATPRRRKQHSRACKGACHCRIFDDCGMARMGILIKENPISKSATSSGRLSHGLFCETDAKPQLQIRCAKCLGAHDPLLTNCSRSKRQHLAATATLSKSRTLPSRYRATGLRHHMLDTSVCSTNYPSDTEVTFTRRSVSESGSSAESSSSMDSDATYTTWPPPMRIPSMERLLAENTDPSPWNYVHAWLVNANQPPNSRPPPMGAPAATNTASSSGSKPKTKRNYAPQQQASHRHQHVVQDVYTAYCTVPPRLGHSVKELSVVRNKTLKVALPAVEHQYSTPGEIVV